MERYGSTRTRMIALGFSLALYVALRLLSTLATGALTWYGLVGADWLFAETNKNLVSVILIAVSIFPAAFLLGYIARTWGWLMAVFIEPLYSLCAFAFSPVIQQIAALAAGGSPPAGGYIDWHDLVFLQLLPGIGVAALAGTLGEVVQQLRFRNTSCDSDQKAEPIKSVGDFFRWYFRLSPSIVLRLPILLMAGGLGIATIVLNLPDLLVLLLGGSRIDPATNKLVHINPFLYVFVGLRALLEAAPAVLLPFISRLNLPTSTRLAITVGTVILWALILLSLI